MSSPTFKTLEIGPTQRPYVIALTSPDELMAKQEVSVIPVP